MGTIQLETSNIGYKYTSAEEAKEINRQKANQRYWENKEKINQQHKELARKQREIAGVIMKNPQTYQQFQNYMQITNNPQLYQQFVNYVQLLNNPPLYQHFVNCMNQLPFSSQQPIIELVIQPSVNQ